MLMTQDASASANQQWVCWWLVELHRSEEKIGCNQIWEKGMTPWCWVYLQHGLDQTPFLPKLVWHAPWWKNFPCTDFFFFFKDWTKPSISRLLKTHCLSSQPHRGSLHHWILSEKKKPMRQELQESAEEFSLRIKKMWRWLSLQRLKKEQEGGAGRQDCWGRWWNLGTIHSPGWLL